MQDKIRALGATIIVHGKVWDEADVLAREMAKDVWSCYIPPFDHPDLWEGLLFAISLALTTSR
jgi:L-serine/L-threonine ammonia-lyase